MVVVGLNGSKMTDYRGGKAHYSGFKGTVKRILQGKI